MPCRDDRDDDYKYSNGEAAARKELEPLLCEALSLLEDAGILSKLSPELARWYKAHEACEADRVRYEAVLKLSERERRLLGIDLQAFKAKAKK
jgi:hypothetical protein